MNLCAIYEKFLMAVNSIRNMRMLIKTTTNFTYVFHGLTFFIWRKMIFDIC